MWAVLGLGGGAVIGGTIGFPFGGFDMRVSAKREGCSEAKPLGDAGWEREARAEGRTARRSRRGRSPQEAALFRSGHAAPSYPQAAG